MKIIFICTRSITFNTFLKSQADYFVKKGFNVEIACSDNTNLKFKKGPNYKISFPLKIIDLFNILKYKKIFFQIKSIIQINPNAVFFLHTPIASHFFRLFTFYYKIKLVYFVHGFRFTSKTNFINSLFFKLIEKILSKKTNVFITINREDYDYVKRNFSGRALCYKLNGVGLDKPIKNNRKNFNKKKKIRKILVIAAYKKEKGYLEILKVAEMLKELKFKIDCYGYGKYDQFNNFKINNKLNNISFKKFDINLKKKIKNYDILLHLSKREGLPVSVMQCLASGLPVICYNIRGNNDLIKNNFNGLFVNNYKEVPKKILYLNLNESFFYKLRLNAIKSINKDFFKNKINSRLYKIIKNFLKLS